MATTEQNLHGSDACSPQVMALLIVDMINDLEFEGGEKIAPDAIAAAKRIQLLKQFFASRGYPVIYLNDNFGRWRSDFAAQVRHCLDDHTRGEPMVRLVLPSEEDYFILKPQYSGFFCSPLELLLNQLGVKRLVLSGIAGDRCVQFTANDAYMRSYELIVPTDAIACEEQEDHHQTIAYMQRVLKAEIPTTEDFLAKQRQASIPNPV